MEHKYVERDFSKMMLNVFPVKKSINLLHYFPILNKYEVFSREIPDVNKNEVIRYLVYAYDVQSPFRRNEPDLMKRKFYSGVQAGFKLSGKRFQGQYEDLILLTNTDFTEMVITYCRIQKSQKFSKLVIWEELYYQELQNLSVEQDNAKKKQQIATINLLEKDLESMSADFLGDVNPLLIHALYESVENTHLDLTPEDIARKLINVTDLKKIFEGFDPYEQTTSTETVQYSQVEPASKDL